MSSQGFGRFIPVGVAAVIAFGAGSAAAATCAPKNTDPVDAVRQMYAAATVGDRARTVAAFDREGYLFDGGLRFTPEGITDLILKSEAAGAKRTWTIESAEIHTACDLAWATWTTRGTVTTATGTTSKTWLESGVLIWRDGTWKIRFFHSTPAQPAN